MRSSRFLVLSVLIHFAIFASLYVKKITQKKIEDVPLIVELKSVPKGSLSGDLQKQKADRKRESKTVGSNDKAGSAVSKTARLFSPDGTKKYFGATLDQLSENAQKSSTSGDTFLRDRKRDDPSAPWGQGAETFERIEDYSLFKTLYQRIDSSLAYPGVLAKHQIQGTVNTRFVLDQAGDCDWKYTKIKGQNPYLQLYVLDVLKRICQENFKRYLGGRITTNVDISFQFAISENGSKEYAQERQAIVGNTMMFFRNNQQSVLEWELGPFRGMFPIPAVYLDIEWIQENWDLLIHQKDPLKEFKKQFG